MKTSSLKVLRRDFDNYKSLDVNYHDISTVRGIKMSLTVPLKSFPKVRFNVKFNQTQKPIPDYLECGMAYIVSEKFRDLLNKFDVNAEFFPIQIYLIKQNIFLENYYYFHLMAEENCFDFKESDYETDDDGSIESIDTLRLTFKSQPMNDIFFVGEISFRIICMTEKLGHALEQNNITGIKLTDPEELCW
jgi:hypothetical protein